MKSNKNHLYGLITFLLLIGISLFAYRYLVLNVPLTDNASVNSWMVEAKLRFTAEKNTPVKASFSIPYMPPYFAILDEYFISHNYGVTTNLSGFNREAVWALRRSSGPQSLYYRAIFRETDSNDTYLPKPHFFRPPNLPDNIKTAVETIISHARETSADIQTFAQSTFKELNKKEDGNVKLLVGNDFNEPNIISAAITILNQAKIYAISVKGVHLSQQYHADFKYLAAVYNGKKWIYINPRTGIIGLPKDFLVWQYGNDAMFNIEGGKKAQFSLSVSPTPINALSVAKMRGVQTNSQLMRFSLLQLPQDMQEMFKILLTVPIGAFIILLLRNFIGLKTFGTFMPVLIALAFRETRIVWGVSLFTIIVLFGLLARFYLDQLKLLLVPRLSAILTIVILLMLFISILCQNLGLEAGVSIALFPMVIITMTIERMCITWDERGANEAIKSALGSLLAAIISFFAMNDKTLQYLVFAFPEFLIILLAIVLWVGQYRGYRLFELFRFNAFAEAK